MRTGMEQNVAKGKVVILLARGFEEVDVSAVTRILRGSGFSVSVVGLTAGPTRGAYGLSLVADCALGEVDAELTNFPVLVRLDSGNFDFALARTDGHDIRFTAADGQTLLSYERERHDPAGEEVSEAADRLPQSVDAGLRKVGVLPGLQGILPGLQEVETDGAHGQERIGRIIHHDKIGNIMN